MSFDIFVQRFQNGESATFERKIAEDIFGPYAIQRDKSGGIMRIKYPDGGGADVYGDKQEQIDHLGFDRLVAMLSSMRCFSSPSGLRA